MAQATFDLNDYATQAITRIDSQGRTVLTVTDTVDVVILCLGHRGVAAIEGALSEPVVVEPEEPTVPKDPIDLTPGERFFANEKWWTANVARWDVMGDVEVSVSTEPFHLYFSPTEQVRVAVPACEGSELRSLAGDLRPGDEAA